jgi:hypothetical protein
VSGEAGIGKTSVAEHSWSSAATSAGCCRAWTGRRSRWSPWRSPDPRSRTGRLTFQRTGATMSCMGVRLVERDAELETLLASVDGAAAGRGGSAILVLGEAGIGKTSLVRAFIASVDGAARVLAGACDDLWWRRRGRGRNRGPRRKTGLGAGPGPWRWRHGSV